MFGFLKKWLGRKECNCGHCTCGKSTKIEADWIPLSEKVFIKSGFEIRIPLEVAQKLEDLGYSLSVSKYKGQVSCVHLYKMVNGTSVYAGTLKKFMNVKSFKDGNVCNFSHENIVVKEKEN